MGRDLAQAGYDDFEIQAVVEAVRTASWSRGLEPTSALGVVLQDADRLDAIGAIVIARIFATAQAMRGRGQTQARSSVNVAYPLGTAVSGG